MPTVCPAAEMDFHTLVVSQQPTLVARARCLEGSHGEALDLVQDTLERALRAFPQFRPGAQPIGSVRRWLFRIMHNLFIDRYRRRARERRRLSIDEIDLPAPEPEPSSPWDGFGDHDLRSLLDALDRPFREVLTLHVIEQRSYQDIGRSLRIPTATVGTRLMRARNQLRDLLEPDQRLRGRGMAYRSSRATKVRRGIPSARAAAV